MAIVEHRICYQIHLALSPQNLDFPRMAIDMPIPHEDFPQIGGFFPIASSAKTAASSPCLMVNLRSVHPIFRETDKYIDHPLVNVYLTVENLHFEWVNPL